jgi:hypothetical protein
MKRSSLLSILCVLTFINMGLSIIQNAYPAVAFNSFIVFLEEIQESTNGTLNEIFSNTIDQVTNAGMWYYVVSLILSIAVFYSALLIWKLDKKGLVGYTILQLLILLIPTCFGIEKYPNITGIFITGLFILMYHLAWKKSLPVEEEE